MITCALHDSGLHLIGSGAEELIDAAEDNPEGFWENKAIVAGNDDLLEATGGAWDNPPDLPPQGVDDPRVSHIAEASTAAIAALSEHEHWGFRTPAPASPRPTGSTSNQTSASSSASATRWRWPCP